MELLWEPEDVVMSLFRTSLTWPPDGLIVQVRQGLRHRKTPTNPFLSTADWQWPSQPSSSRSPLPTAPTADPPSAQHLGVRRVFAMIVLRRDRPLALICDPIRGFPFLWT